MPHLPEVAEDLLDSIVSAGAFRVDHVASKKLRLEVAYCKCRNTILTGVMPGEELISTNGSSVSLLQVGLHLGLTCGAAKVFMIPLAPCNATLAPRVVWDVSEAVNTEFLGAHAVRALSRSRCPAFFDFFFFFFAVRARSEKVPGSSRSSPVPGNSGTLVPGFTVIRHGIES